MELHLSAVVIVRGPHRPHHGDVVDAFRYVRPPIADFNSALAALLEAHLQGIQAWMNLVKPGDPLAQVLFDERILLKIVERRIAQTPAAELSQCRFWIERFHM